MRIGVYIPSIPRHFGHLDGIIKAYYGGTRAPDRLMVFLSGANEVAAENTTGLKKANPGIEIVLHSTIVQAGPARQKAVQLLADCDIVSYQDSDDLPHATRLQVVERWFEANPDALSMYHSYLRGMQWPKDAAAKMAEPQKTIWARELSKYYFPSGSFFDAKAQPCFGTGCPWMTHAGVPSVRPGFLRNITWKKAEELRIAPEPRTKTEDFEFGFESVFRYPNQVGLVSTPCYLYRV